MQTAAVKIPAEIRAECPLPDGYIWKEDGDAPGIRYETNDAARWFSWAWTGREGPRKWQVNAYGSPQWVNVPPFDSLEDALRYIWLQLIHGDFK